jgi:hypothetical protein
MEIGLSPILTGNYSLISLIMVTLIGSKRCSCWVSSTNTPVDRPQPCDCLIVGLYGTPPINIGPYAHRPLETHDIM